MTNINIVPLQEIEYDQWLNLWKNYQKFYQVNLSSEVNQNTWTKLTHPNFSSMYGFATLVDQKIVGIVHIIEHESCWTLQPYAYLQDLFVDEHYRGLGIAKKLILTAEQQTQQRQCDRLYWLTHQDNVTAQQLYDKIARKTGFIQYRLG